MAKRKVRKPSTEHRKVADDIVESWHIGGRSLADRIVDALAEAEARGLERAVQLAHEWANGRRDTARFGSAAESTALRGEAGVLDALAAAIRTLAAKDS